MLPVDLDSDFLRCLEPFSGPTDNIHQNVSAVAFTTDAFCNNVKTKTKKLNKMTFFLLFTSKFHYSLVWRTTQ